MLNVNYHAVTPMNEIEFHVGRPHGGCAIMWKSNLACDVVPINACSKRLCCVKLVLQPSNVSVLLCSVYMPCDTQYNQANLNEFNEVLEEMSFLAIAYDSDHLVFCGDFNTDFARCLSLHTRALSNFLHQESLCDLRTMPDCYHVDFTFESFVDGSRTTIDHVFVSENLKTLVNNVYTIHSPDNLSDHCPLICEIKLPNATATQPERLGRSKPLWRRASPGEIDMYCLKLNTLCQEYQAPGAATECNDAFCQDPAHLRELQCYHDYLVAACLTADSEIPKSSQSRRKRIAGWTEHVKPLHQKALFWHSIWTECGRPLTGAVADIRRHTRRKYHKAAKRAASLESAMRFERMAQNGEHSCDKRDFWTQVKKMKNSAGQCPSSVDGAVNQDEIANVFLQKYQMLYNSVGYDANQLQIVKDRISQMIAQHAPDDCHSFTARDISKAAAQLKRDKHDGNAGLYTDHVKNAPNLFYQHLSELFNAVMRHAFAPDAFRVSVMIPIPKNTRKSLNNSENYRAIALSSILNKLLDKIILKKCSSALESSPYQFGFKKCHSTNMCSFVVNEVIDFFHSRGSPVFACLLDCSKAFDRIDYFKMFSVLLNIQLCPFVIRLLLSLYCQQSACVKWRSSISPTFSVQNGVKQGGVISPVLFTLYMDVLLTQLAAKGAGCWLAGHYVGSLAYADDIILLAPSRRTLISMLETCSVFASDYNVMFNGSKSKLIVFGNCDPKPVTFMHQDLEIVLNDKHLGVPLGRDCNQLLIDTFCRELMSKTNMLHANFRHLPTDLLYLLFKTHCTPLYGSQLIDFTSRDTGKIFVTWRKAIRFLFQLPTTTHCDLLPLICNDIPINRQLHIRTAKFFLTCLNSSNNIVQLCAQLSQNGTSQFARNLTYLSRLYNCPKSQIASAATDKAYHVDCSYNLNAVTASLIRCLIESRRECFLNQPFFKLCEINYAIVKLCTE